MLEVRVLSGVLAFTPQIIGYHVHRGLDVPLGFDAKNANASFIASFL